LQLVLEKVTGRPLDTQLREEITGPLGMRRTRYNPPASSKPKIAATEDARLPWSGLDRRPPRGEVHGEQAYSRGGGAGHAGGRSASSSTSTGTWARWPPRARRATPASPGGPWCSTRPPTPSWSSSATPCTRCAAGAPDPLPGWRPPTTWHVRCRCGPPRDGPPG